MARADELGNDGGADPAGRAGDEYAHEKPPVESTVFGEDIALRRPMSVTAIRVARDVSHCHRLGSGYGSMGAKRARPAHAGRARALRRARVRADHGGGDRHAGRADGANVLPALRRQARGSVRGRGRSSRSSSSARSPVRPSSLAPIDAAAAGLEAAGASHPGGRRSRAAAPGHHLLPARSCKSAS